MAGRSRGLTRCRGQSWPPPAEPRGRSLWLCELAISRRRCMGAQRARRSADAKTGCRESAASPHVLVRLCLCGCASAHVCDGCSHDAVVCMDNYWCLHGQLHVARSGISMHLGAASTLVTGATFYQKGPLASCMTCYMHLAPATGRASQEGCRRTLSRLGALCSNPQAE